MEEGHADGGGRGVTSCEDLKSNLLNQLVAREAVVDEGLGDVGPLVSLLGLGEALVYEFRCEPVSQCLVN